MNETEFFEAIRGDDHARFVSAIGNAADLNHVIRTRYENWFSGIGATALQLTAFVRPQFAQLLLDRGAKMDLHSACALGELDVVRQALMEDESAIEHQVDTYYPIQFALEHPAVLRTLLENGDEPNRPVQKLAWFEWEDPAANRGLSDRRLMHMVAVGRGSIDSATTLRDFGADLNAESSPFGELPIHLAAICDREPMIRWLIQNGVYVDSRTAEAAHTPANTDLFDTRAFAPFDGFGKTPLMLALGEGQANAVNCLLDLEADVNSVDSVGFTPLHYAAGAFWKENPAHVERLLELGAEPNVTDSQGRRPIDLARKREYSRNTELLSTNR